MKRYLILSIALHLIIVAGLILFSSADSGGISYPEVYRVNLVSKPMMRGISAPKQTQTTGKDQKRIVQSQPEAKNLYMKEKSADPHKGIETVKPGAKGQGNPNSKDQKIDDYPDFLDGVDFGNEFGGIRIDAAEFESSYYINLILGKIRSRWVNPVKMINSIETTIFFQVDANGKIRDAEIEASSGIEAFDQSALRAILTSDPLPPLPQEFSGDHIGIHLKFEYLP